MFRGGNLKDVAAAQGLAEQKGANFLKNGIFPRQYAKMGNRVCKSLPRLVFCFTAKKVEVQFSQALYKVEQKRGMGFWKIRLLKGMCEIADSCVQKVAPG